MGTNFYFVSDLAPALHIGKRSAGWQFTFQAHTEPHVRSFNDWVGLFENVPGSYILDEYGRRYDTVEFCTQVVLPSKGKRTPERMPGRWHKPDESWFDEQGWAIHTFEFC